MVAEKKTTSRRKKIPDYLIREMIDGQPLYYKGYKEVLRKKKTFEEIMGSSSLQAVLVTYLSILCGKYDLDKKYRILSGEAGLHIDTGNNLAGDLMIYDRTVLPFSKISVHYADVPPLIDVEVDIMIESENLKDQQYMRKKTEKLHQFGTEKVIWILTASQQVVVAMTGKPWLTYDWNESIELLDGVTFNIGQYLRQESESFSE
jgi:hypothetical protein